MGVWCGCRQGMNRERRNRRIQPRYPSRIAVADSRAARFFDDDFRGDAAAPCHDRAASRHAPLRKSRRPRGSSRRISEAPRRLSGRARPSPTPRGLVFVPEGAADEPIKNCSSGRPMAQQLLASAQAAGMILPRPTTPKKGTKK